MKTILITGATGAIGAALARQIVKSTDNRVLLAARDLDRLNQLQSELEGLRSGAVASVLSLDFALHTAADLTAAGQTLAQSMEAIGGIDALAHCVGSTVVRPLHLTSEADWMNQLATNTSSAWVVLKQGIAAAIKAKKPFDAVLVSSVVAHAGFANHEAIAAAKAGVAALAQTAAATYAAKQVRVNVVAPGLTRSNLTARFIATPEALERSAGMIPSGRIGEPEDVAGVISFLLSPAAAHMTGQILQVAGGQGGLHPLKA